MEQVLWNQDTCTYVHTLLLKIMYQVDTYVRMCCFLHYGPILVTITPPPTHTHVRACVHTLRDVQVCLSSCTVCWIHLFSILQLGFSSGSSSPSNLSQVPPVSCWISHMGLMAM